jgi:hypothetical protein
MTTKQHTSNPSNQQSSGAPMRSLEPAPVRNAYQSIADKTLLVAQALNGDHSDAARKAAPQTQAEAAGDRDRLVEASASGEAELEASRRASRAGEAARQAQEEALARSEQNAREKASQPLTNLHDLAERIGVDVADVYKLKVPTGMGENEFVSLSELKDAHKNKLQHALDVLAWTDAKMKKEGDFTRAQSELADILSGVPKEALEPKMLERMQQRNAERMEREREQLMGKVPEWKEDTRRKTELASIAKSLESYGFDSQFLSGINDHRLMHYMRDNWIREQRINDALAAIKELKPKSISTQSTHSPSRQTSDSTLNGARGRFAQTSDKVSAVAKLLSP